MIFTSLQCSHGPGAKALCIYLAIFYIHIFFIIYNQNEKLMTNSHLPIMRHVTAHWMSSHFIFTQFIAQGNGSDNTAQKTEYPVTFYDIFQQIKVCKCSHGLIFWFFQKPLPNSQPNTAEVWVLSSLQSQPSGWTCACISTAIISHCFQVPAINTFPLPITLHFSLLCSHIFSADFAIGLCLGGRFQPQAGGTTDTKESHEIAEVRKDLKDCWVQPSAQHHHHVHH